MRYKILALQTTNPSLVQTRLSARLFTALATVLALTLTSPGLQADPLLTYPLRIDDHAIRAELANTPQTRRKGLMYRQKMATSSGMIFIFRDPRTVSMWMKNTYIPLSVAFIDESGRILNIEDMKPHDEQSHSSIKPAKYALEMNQGWFARRGIGAGDLVRGLERLPEAK